MPKQGQMEWEIRKDKQGKFRWVLLSHTGPIGQSVIGYTRRTSCERIIDSIKKKAPTAPIVDFKIGN